MALRYATELGAFDRIKNDLAFQVRRRIFERFMRECAPGSEARVADFGVSGHRDHPVHYFFESLYPYRQQVTAIGRAAEGRAGSPRTFRGCDPGGGSPRDSAPRRVLRLRNLQRGGRARGNA